MSEKWDVDTNIRLRDWSERTDDDKTPEGDITIILDRLETIMQLRDVQDLAPPRH